MTKATAPSIYNVTDDEGKELAQGASTSKKAVSVFGKTGVGQAGDLKNGEVLLAGFKGGSDGHWSVNLNLKVGTYKFKATSGDGTSFERILFVTDAS
ncbi:hypothetical protein ACK3BE_05330 [Pseudomonas mandelii]|uniref:hypothetical protein n=1 Tax=Pseudomonas mandelii TaxID=75612 RepID=UPI00398D2F64